jgi:hypothetical protein
MGLRAFDPKSGQWAIWWLDARDPTSLGSPVLGRFEGDEGTFNGTDNFDGKPVDVRFHWENIHGPLPHWQQSFSPDGGRTWEVNFENFFTRTSEAPSPISAQPGELPRTAPADWDFLAGSWTVRHKRLAARLAGSKEWHEFDGTLVNWPVMGGAGNVGDNVMNLPSGTIRGVGFRAYDPASKKWLSWWLDGRDPTSIGEPMRGGFSGTAGMLEAKDTYDGKPIVVRVTWSHDGRKSARWEQAFSADGGQTWETNWVSDFDRKA